MNIQESGKWIHRINTSAALVLLTTGVLHTLPDLRSSLIGGYDRLIADIHMWTGALFICFPLLILSRTRDSLLRNLRIRIFKDPEWHWRRFNLTFSILICLSQATAGALIWFDSIVPLWVELVDSLFIVHQAGAWYIGLLLPIHLWMARVAVVRTCREWLGLKTAEE